MKKSTKTLLIISCICLALGITLSITAVCLVGGRLGDLWAQGEFFAVKKEISTEGITKFHYEGSSRNVYILPTDKKNLIVSYHEEDEGIAYEFESKNGTVTMTYRRGALAGESFVYQKNVYDVYIYVPAAISDIQISTSSGDVDISGVQMRGVRVDTSSGDVHVSEIQGEELRLKTSSGDIYVGETVLTDTLYFDVSFGDVDLNQVKTDGYVRGESVSGNVGARELTTNMLRFISASGNFAMERGAFEKAEIRTSSGDVALVGLLPREERYYRLVTASGDTTWDAAYIHNEPNGEFTGPRFMYLIDIETASGDIEVSPLIAGADVFYDDIVDNAVEVSVGSAWIGGRFTKYFEKHPEISDHETFRNAVLSPTGENKDRVMAFLRSLELVPATEPIYGEKHDAAFRADDRASPHYILWGAGPMCIECSDGTRYFMDYAGDQIRFHREGEPQYAKEYVVLGGDIGTRLHAAFGFAIENSELILLD